MQFVPQFCLHHHCMKFVFFNCPHHFWTECGLGGHLNLILNLFLKNVFFNFIFTFRIANYRIIIIIISIMS